MGVRVSFDGACQPARGGGIATWAFVVEGEGLDTEGSGLAAPAGSPESTNNVAEYSGALRGLEYLLQRGYRGPVVLQGDSQLVIRQLEGGYRGTGRSPETAERPGPFGPGVLPIVPAALGASGRERARERAHPGGAPAGPAHRSHGAV
ncbi:ribonuclease H [mine drainage metagenome]|uniref:Ribonuclease H n=1 Tax=mine drainage metagenome TaxID=410659 RepID=T1BXV0_9ZZZZ